MADNIYLLETRLSKAQQTALASVREIARVRGLTVFLVGGAVRDLISGTAVRDLDVVVQGNALKLKKDIEKAGGVISGDMEPLQAVFVRFPGGVRMEVGSTLTVTYPKPGKAVAKPATILDDLRRRDFTANAMALSLNEGSYGLLMDPLNGVADIENRELRLVSNYGFIEDPVRMVRAARYMARLGWGLEEKTQTRYETGKTEGYISAMDPFHRGYETEEIFHEDDPLRVIRRLEEEGWMQHLFPALSATKANVAELERLRESQAQLQMQGIVADGATVSFPLLTAKMSSKEIETLKKSFPRQGFVQELEGIEAKGKEFSGLLGAKGAALPSQAFKLITSTDPEAALWAAHTTKSAALQAKFKSFYTEWPQARQRVPHLLMQEMRITSDLADYETLVDKLFFELMDGKLNTPEEMKAFLEPYSPPAPPPPVSLRRPRAPKKEAKPAKSRKKVAEAAASGPEAENGGTQEMPPEGTTPAPPSAEAATATPPPTKLEKAQKPIGPSKNAPTATKPAVPAVTAVPTKSFVPAKKAAPASGAAGRGMTAKKSSATRLAPAAAKSSAQKKGSSAKAATAKKPATKRSAPAKKTAPARPVKQAAKKASAKTSKKAAVNTKSGRGAPSVVKKAVAKSGVKKPPARGSAGAKKTAAKKRR